MNWLIESPIPLAIAGVLYICMSIAYFKRGENGMCLAFAAYSLANVGFIWAWYR